MKAIEKIGIYLIVLQDRVCASPKQGLRQSWNEYQVRQGRKVLSRHDTLSQARRDADERRTKAMEGVVF